VCVVEASAAGARAMLGVRARADKERKLPCRRPRRQDPVPKPFAFPREKRLIRGRDFQRVYREGGRARGESVVVVACANGSEISRLGLSVGRTIWKSAVKRNKIRRVFREAFRLSYPELPHGVDVVLIPARPKLVPVLAEIRAELVPLVRKALAKRSVRERSSESSGATP
jgi:ribonuclease P protein component